MRHICTKKETMKNNGGKKEMEKNKKWEKENERKGGKVKEVGGEK